MAGKSCSFVCLGQMGDLSWLWIAARDVVSHRGCCEQQHGAPRNGF